MNKVITISREFGSGGHEIGYKLSQKLNIPFYDRNIIIEVAHECGFDEEYTESLSERKIINNFPIYFGRTLSQFNALSPSDTIFIKQSEYLRKCASEGPCVIVGRCANYVLQDYDCCHVFIFADMKSRLARCKRNAPENENYDDNKLLKEIKLVDKKRSKYHEYYTELDWGKRENYHLCIDTTDISVEKAVNLIIEYIS